MQGFQDVTLSWDGVDYVVPADQQMELIAEIEDALSDGTGTPAVAILSRHGGPSHSRLAKAFAAALRYAGAQVTGDEVYLALQKDIADRSVSVQAKMQMTTLGLLAILSPPMMSKVSEMMETSTPGKPPAPITD